MGTRARYVARGAHRVYTDAKLNKQGVRVDAGNYGMMRFTSAPPQIRVRKGSRLVLAPLLIPRDHRASKLQNRSSKA